jgi:hypothetical protein
LLAEVETLVNGEVNRMTTFLGPMHIACKVSAQEDYSKEIGHKKYQPHIINLQDSSTEHKVNTMMNH